MHTAFPIGLLHNEATQKLFARGRTGVSLGLWPSGLRRPQQGRAHVPLEHRLREQRTGPKHAVSADHEAAAAVAVDVRGVRGLALQQGDARPLIQLIVSGREPVAAPRGPANGYG